MTRRWWLVLRTAVFSVLVPGTLGGWLPVWIGHQGGSEWPSALGLRALGGMLLLSVGTLLYLRCAAGFVLDGDGTPAPFDAPSRLVIRGPYRYTRNPMYVSVLTAALGHAVLMASGPLLWYTLALAGGFTLFVIGCEEPMLRRRFGADYQRYREKVPRWLPLQQRPRAG